MLEKFAKTGHNQTENKPQVGENFRSKSILIGEPPPPKTHLSLRSWFSLLKKFHRLVQHIFFHESLSTCCTKNSAHAKANCSLDINTLILANRSFNSSLRADSTVSAEERKGEESSLQSLRNGDQFCVLSSQIFWNRLGLVARFNFCSYLCSAFPA